MNEELPIISPLTFVIGIMVAYRISLLFAKESGPAFIFRKLRRMPPPKSSAKEGLSCLWCLSVYSAALVTLFFWWRGYISTWNTPLVWLATSSGAIAMNQTFTKS